MAHLPSQHCSITSIQMNSGNDMQKNIDKVHYYTAQACENGADIITLPENFSFMAAHYDELWDNSYYPEHHPALQAMQNCAKKHKIWMFLGSLSVKSPQKKKLANQSFVINREGNIVASYTKIHLFDAAVPGGETHQESRWFIAGRNAVLVDTPWGKVGLSICYDLRFPYLYRYLALKGASIIMVPSAFTFATGQAHWHILLRARAIENSCYIIASAQTGYHPRKRRTYGHSLMIDPWGKIVGEIPEKEGWINCKIDLGKVTETRNYLPSLLHGRDFE